MMHKYRLGIALLGLAAFGLLASVSEKISTNRLINEIIATQLADTTRKIKLPDGVDPNSDDWKGADLSEKDPVKPLSPQEQAKLFQLPPGYKIEPVLTEPAIQQPAEIVVDVFDHAEKSEFVYEHVWSVGDLLLWDNRCSSHARTDFPADQRRLMLRTTIEGTVKPY